MFPPPAVVTPAPVPVDDLPVRPPVLCPGCPHRAVYAMLRREKVAVMGDIGCYTLGALPPLLSLESCVCMGASIGMMAGMNRMMGRAAAVAVIGDSTFFHSGITPLIDARYNDTPGLVIVLDNRTTAMTGHQGHPGTGLHADRSSGPAVDIDALCRGIGVPVTTVDAFDEARGQEGHQKRARQQRGERAGGAGALHPHGPLAARAGGGRRRPLQPLRPLRRARLPGPRGRPRVDRDHERLHRLRRLPRGVRARRRQSARGGRRRGRAP